MLKATNLCIGEKPFAISIDLDMCVICVCYQSRNRVADVVFSLLQNGKYV